MGDGREGKVEVVRSLIDSNCHDASRKSESMMRKEVSGDEDWVDWLDFELMIGLKKRTVCLYWLLNPFSFSPHFLIFFIFDFSPFLFFGCCIFRSFDASVVLSTVRK